MAVQGERSSATCAAPCWYAHQPVCVCSCGGKNHGCMLTPGGSQPQRVTRRRDAEFRLVAVVHTLLEAREWVVAQGGVMGIKFGGADPGDYVYDRAPQSAFGKWPELEAFIPMHPHEPWPYGVWECVA